MSGGNALPRTTREAAIEAAGQAYAQVWAEMVADGTAPAVFDTRAELEPKRRPLKRVPSRPAA